MYVMLVCVWCSLDAGGFRVVVSAQPTVYAEILTPEADRLEGEQVDMRCTATNLESDHFVEWISENPVLVLRWGGATLDDNNGRFIFNTSVDMGTQTVVQDFTIINVQRADTDEYVCNVNDPILGEGYEIIATSRVTLSVTSLNNGPIVTMTILISSDPVSSSSPWILAFMVAMFFVFTLFFIIVILIFCRVRQNRLIKSLRSVKEPQVTKAETYIELQPTEDTNRVYMEPTTAAETITTQTEPDPYMELQPTEDTNRVYMEPTTAAQTIATQSTYYQPVEEEKGNPEYDYARPEDITDTSYEVPVRAPQSSAD